MVDRRKSNDLSVADYVQAARFHPWAVVLPMVVIGIATWLLLGRGGDVYQAEAQVVVSTTEAQETFDRAVADRANQAKFLANEVRFAKGDLVLDELMAALGDAAPDDVEDLDIGVSADADADVLLFEARAESPQGAADLANAYARIYVEQRRADAVAGYDGAIDLIEVELEALRVSRAALRVDLDALIVQLAGLDPGSAQRPGLEARRAQLEAQIGSQLAFLDSQEAALTENLSRLKISQQLASTGTARVSIAAVPDPDPLPNAGIRALVVGEIIGLILGLLAAVALENRNDRLREPAEVERAFPTLPVLGSLPYESAVRKRREVTVLASPHSGFSEAIYQVRTSLRFLTMEQGVRLVVVTSPNPSEGKTTFTVNFAWALAGLDEPVVLIDGDLRRPVAHQHFGVELTPGLTDLVIDKRPLNTVAIRFEEQDGNLSMVPAGTHHGNPADFMGSMQLVDRVRQISAEALTIVDAAPVLPVSDSRGLAGASDLTIVMVRLGATRRSELAAAIQNLRNAGASSIALVLVGVKPESSSYYGRDDGRSRPDGAAHPTPSWRLGPSSSGRIPAAKTAMAPAETRGEMARPQSSVPRESGPRMPPRLADGPGWADQDRLSRSVPTERDGFRDESAKRQAAKDDMVKRQEARDQAAKRQEAKKAKDAQDDPAKRQEARSTQPVRNEPANGSSTRRDPDGDADRKPSPATKSSSSPSNPPRPGSPR